MVNWIELLAGLVAGIIYSDISGRITFCGNRRKFRKNLYDMFFFNLTRCGQMETQIIEKIKEKWFPDYLFDAGSIKELMFNGRNYFKDQEEFDEINWRRYQLDHLNNKLAIITNGGGSDQYIRGFLQSLSREKTAIEELLVELKK